MLDLFRRAAVVALFMSVPAWSFAQTAAAPKAISDAERAAIRALIAKMPEDGQRRFYDLTDAGEELALRALLRLNGRTPQNRPYQFRMIEERKAEQLAMRARNLPLEPPKVATSAFNAVEVPADLDQILNIGTNDWKTISSVAFSTYYNGSTWVETAVNVFDAEGKPIADGIKEEYGDGRILSVPSSDGANPSGKEIYSVGTYYYIDRSTGQPVGPLGSRMTGGYYPKQVSDTKPQITTSNKNVVVCLNRANPDPQNPTKCDYGPTDPNVPNNQVKVKIPFQGAIEYFSDIEVDPVTKKPPVYTVRLYLVGQTAGGICKGVDVGSTFMDNPNTKVVGNTISWNMEYADFGNVCYANNEFYTLTFALMLPFSKVPVWATITNDPKTKQTISTMKIPALQVQYGCVLGGTEVQMADGTKRAIENIKIGDMVAGRKGPLYVNSTTVGWDFEFVELMDDARGKVTVTPGHPVVTKRGLVKASDVKRGDIVYTPDRGHATARITEARFVRETKARNVYNLMLTEANGPPPKNPIDANFYAGNILIGDMEGQRQLMQKPVNLAAVRDRLPKGMRVDFDNWRKEQAAAK